MYVRTQEKRQAKNKVARMLETKEKQAADIASLTDQVKAAGQEDVEILHKCKYFV